MANTREFTNGMQLGLGYDLLAEKIRSKAVDGDSTELSIPYDSRFFFREVTSQSQLANFLGISASMSAKINILNTGSLNSGITTNFVSQANINNYCSYFLIQSIVTSSEVTIQEPKLVDSAINLLNDGKSDVFRRKFGDEFITGLVKGGKFIAFIKLKSDNEETKEKISYDFNSKIGFNHSKVSPTLDTSAKSSIINFLNRYHSMAEVEVYQQAISPVKNPKDIREVLDCLDNFQKQMENNKFVGYQVRLADYYTSDLTPYTHLIDIKKQQQYIESIVKKRSEFLSKLNDIEYIINNQNKFETFNINDFKDKRNLINKKVEEIERVIQKCVDDGSSFKDFQLPEDSCLEFSLPLGIKNKPSLRPFSGVGSFIPKLIDRVLGTSPKEIPVITEEYIYMRSIQMYRANPNIKRIMVLRNNPPAKSGLHHLVIVYLDEKNNPVSDNKGNSITQEYLSESLDDDLTEIFESKDRYFIEFK